jgi:hypothetical protein
MGIFNLNKRLLIIIGAIFIVFVAILLVAISQQPKQISGDVATTYTSSITGKESTIFPDKGSELGAQAPDVTIYSIEELYNRYIDYQAASVQGQVHDFIFATSGGRATVAGIVDGTITSIDGKKDQFTLFINNPETTYDVTVVVESQAQQTPFVTFKEHSRE